MVFEALVAVLPADGSEVPFEQFMAQARAVGAPVNLWLKAKHAGVIQTRINESGQHVVKRA